MQAVRALLKFLQWGQTTVSSRFLELALRLLLDTDADAVRCMAPVRPRVPQPKSRGRARA